MTALQVHNLTAGYDQRAAVHHLDFNIPAGALAAVVGPNGGGKSTLLKAMAGLLRPMSGHVHYPTHGRHCFSYLPQVSAIDRDFPLTVQEVVEMGHWRRAGFYRALRPAEIAATRAALARVRMESLAARPIHALSVGQFQRVLFARLITEDCDCLLLDEPFAAIDRATTDELLILLSEWQKQGKTIVCVVHDEAMVRERFSHAYILARELVAGGEVAAVMTADNLERAQALARGWHDQDIACALPPDYRHQECTHDH